MQSEIDYATTVQYGILANILSLVLFLKFRTHPTFQRCFDLAKYAWIMQVVLPLVPATNMLTLLLKILITYGFGFDYMMLSISGSVSVEGILFRFLTNFAHHMTTLESSSDSTWILKLAYAICWLSHVFPWLQLFGKMHWLKNIAMIGNFAPVLAFLWLKETGDYETTLSNASKGVLWMMIMYRGLYINGHFHVLTRFGVCSKQEEADFTSKAKVLTILASTVVVAQQLRGCFLPNHYLVYL